MLEIRNLKGDIMATVEGQSLDRQDFSGATMREANFEGASLREVIFALSNLEGASFVNADLTDADFTRANLRYACLNGANLTEANLSDAVLAPSEMRGANLCGAVLTNADLHGAVLDGARYNHETRWPQGIEPRAHGAVAVDASAADDICKQANLLLRERDLKGAIEMLTTALWEHPRSADLQQALGCAYALDGRHDDAYRHFRDALKIDAFSAPTHYDLAVLFCTVGLPSLATEHLEKALHLDARYDKARRMLERLKEKAPV